MPYKQETRPSRQANGRATVKHRSRLYISDDLLIKLATIGGCIFAAYLGCMFWGVIPCP